jgi:hypothetical protein
MPPKVTLIIPTHNRAGLLPSVLKIALMSLLPASFVASIATGMPRNSTNCRPSRCMARLRNNRQSSPTIPL